MKIYSVKPHSPTIRVSDGRTISGEGEIGWGDSGMGAMYLARAILTDVLGDKTRAVNLAQRFKWRTFVNWSKDHAHAITEDEVLALVADIEKSASEHAPMVARQAREKPMMLTDRPAPGQAYRSNPDLKRNDPIKKETPHDDERTDADDSAAVQGTGRPAGTEGAA